MGQVDVALSRFAGNFNCSQSVLAGLAPELGLPEETALRVAAAFGGGIARSGNVCGAVSGAMMAIGLKYGATTANDKAAKDRTYAVAADFMARFRAKHGDVTCQALLVGCDIRTPEGRQQAKEGGLFDTLCADYVRDAVEIALEVMA